MNTMSHYRPLISKTLSRKLLACLIFATIIHGGLGMSLLAAAVAPTLHPFTPGGNGVVSGKVDHHLEYTGTATSFSAIGLPKGLKLDTKTGWITGRPLIAGDYTIIFTASNAGAKSAPLVIPWTVEPLPTGTAGTYHALLDRHPWYNGGYGGSIQITITASGTYSGFITRGIHRAQIKGVLDTVPGNGSDPESSFLVIRRQPYAPLTISFTLPIGLGSITGTLNEPEGAGWALQTISSTGTVAWTSRLADGTASTFSTALGAQGQTGVHLMLYGNLGSVQGSLLFDSVDDTTSGSLGWVKSPVSSRSYSGGFPLHFLSAEGALYTPPAATDLIFGIRTGADNARLLFTQGG